MKRRQMNAQHLPHANEKKESKKMRQISDGDLQILADYIIENCENSIDREEMLEIIALAQSTMDISHEDAYTIHLMRNAGEAEAEW